LIKWLIQRAYFGEAILTVFRLAPYVSIWIALVFSNLYPNTRVRFRSALWAASWQHRMGDCQWAYFHFQVGVANYNAIYGTLAALPFFWSGCTPAG